ncbi:MAG: beta-glucanase precursor [Planctomycetes bacterium]|nr:beta-glucanase precursor [Planctomycetota bacterium]
MKHFIAKLSLCITVAAIFVTIGNIAKAEDDNRSFKLTAKAWDLLAEKKYDEALKVIETCEKLYGAQAKEMQKSLKEYPKNDPKEETEKYWALNDVGTCMYIKGEVLVQKGDKAAAIKAYKSCMNDYGYCQCWDPKGWFWKPAEAAKKKVVELEFDDE